MAYLLVSYSFGSMESVFSDDRKLVPHSLQCLRRMPVEVCKFMFGLVCVGLIELLDIPRVGLHER
eukprot:6085096-Amphidinium_carterae.1